VNRIIARSILKRLPPQATVFQTVRWSHSDGGDNAKRNGAGPRDEVPCRANYLEDCHPWL